MYLINIHEINLAIWPLMAKIFKNDSAKQSHLLCGEGGGEGKGEAKGRDTGLCRAKKHNGQAENDLFYAH